MVQQSHTFSPETRGKRENIFIITKILLVRVASRGDLASYPQSRLMSACQIQN
jgi:hypothetical protein